MQFLGRHLSDLRVWICEYTLLKSAGMLSQLWGLALRDVAKTLTPYLEQFHQGSRTEHFRLQPDQCFLVQGREHKVVCDGGYVLGQSKQGKRGRTILRWHCR